jgi:xanthine dehydrogenase accessory factor
MIKVLQALCDAAGRGQGVVFTALVETRGSTPQKAGATMLVFPDGSQVGTLGGGCVEAEVKRKALALLDQGSTEILSFQLDHDYGWDDGLICGGRMQMLVDPIRPESDIGYYRTYLDRLTTGAGCTEAIVLDRREGQPAGARFLFDEHGELLRSAGTAEPDCGLLEGLKPLSGRNRPYVAGGVSYLTSLPRCRLIIVGAGHVGQKTASLAAEVDFDVEVIDDRGDYCSAERFPSAKRLHTGPIDEVLPAFSTRPDDFGIIVTRGHHHDEQALLHLIRKPFRYLGMIGSRRKIRMIFDDLEREGISREALSRVHAPLGLDLGSQTVPEIAIAIVAELISVRNRSETPGAISQMKDVLRSAQSEGMPTS